MTARRQAAGSTGGDDSDEPGGDANDEPGQDDNDDACDEVPETLAPHNQMLSGGEQDSADNGDDAEPMAVDQSAT